MAPSSQRDFRNDVLKLNFGDLKLYGRAKELATLMDAYRSVNNSSNSDDDDDDSRRRIVMVQGYSGTGKSTLVHELEKHQGGNFCSGKFQQLRGTEPFSALASAFSELCNAIIVESSNKETTELIHKIQTNLTTTEKHVLLKVLPTLRKLLLYRENDENKTIIPVISSSDDQIGKTEALNQLKSAFRSLVRTISSPLHPLVLFLDDLQWADDASLDMIKFVTTDSSSRNFLFVGAYRDNEVTPGGVHPLALFLRDVEKEHDIVRIKVDNLEEAAVNQLVADLVKLDTDRTEPLTRVLYQKTHGNVFFVLQLVDHLQQQKLLYYNFGTYQWTWDMDRIEHETDISDNVVELVAVKIKRLDEDVQSVIKIASCLSSTFAAKLLSTLCSELNKDEQIDVLNVLEIAASEGLLDSKGAGRYKFSHDRIQQAAYSLIPEGRDRELLHLKIGEQLQQMMKKDAVDKSNEWISFVAADQLNQGSRHIKDAQKRVELAKLNLESGKSAVNMSAYVPALVYLKAGIQLLDAEKKWEEHYELTLDLMITAAEVSYAVGDFELSDKLSKEVLMEARTTHDKGRVQICYLESLAAQERLEDALEFGYRAVTELGERIPQKLLIFHIVTSMTKINKMLKGLTDEDILGLPLMKDHNKITATRLLCSMARYSWFLQRPKEMVVMIFRVFSIMLSFGLCRFSPEVAVVFGIAKTSVGDLQDGYRFGQLALKLCEKVDAKESECVALVIAATFLNHWILPLQDCLDPMLRAHRIGMEMGNVEQAMLGAGSYLDIYFASGLPLEPYESDARSFCQQMIEYNQETVFRIVVPRWQLALNLMGRSENPLVLTGEAMAQDEFLAKIAANNNRAAEQTMWLDRAQLGYYFDDLELAVEMIESLGKTMENMKAHVYNYSFMFFRGLISIEMYQRSKKTVFKRRAVASIQGLKRLASRGAINCVHKVLLLRADYAAVTYRNKRKSKEKVKKGFDEAIAVATRSGFLQDVALANERAGLFFSRMGSDDDRFWASSYLARAHETYTEWGAIGKASDLESRLGGSFLKNSSSTAFSSGCKAVPRFDDSTGTKNRKIRLDAERD